MVERTLLVTEAKIEEKGDRMSDIGPKDIVVGFWEDDVEMKRGDKTSGISTRKP